MPVPVPVPVPVAGSPPAPGGRAVLQKTRTCPAHPHGTVWPCPRVRTHPRSPVHRGRAGELRRAGRDGDVPGGGSPGPGASGAEPLPGPAPGRGSGLRGGASCPGGTPRRPAHRRPARHGRAPQRGRNPGRRCPRCYRPTATPRTTRPRRRGRSRLPRQDHRPPRPRDRRDMEPIRLGRSRKVADRPVSSGTGPGRTGGHTGGPPVRTLREWKTTRPPGFVHVRRPPYGGTSARMPVSIFVGSRRGCTAVRRAGCSPR